MHGRRLHKGMGLLAMLTVVSVLRTVSRSGADDSRLLFCSMRATCTTVLLIGPIRAQRGLLPVCMTMQLGIRLCRKAKGLCMRLLYAKLPLGTVKCSMVE